MASFTSDRKRRLPRLVRALDRLFASAAVACLVALIVVVIIQILDRVLLPFSSVWTEELSLYLFIYMIALSAGLVVRDGRNVRLDLFVYRIGPRGQAIHRALVCLLLACFSAAQLVPAWRFSEVGALRMSSTLNVPMSVPFSAMLVLFALVTLYSVLGFVEALATLRRPEPAVAQE